MSTISSFSLSPEKYEYKPWDLSQEEANLVAQNREWSYEDLMDVLKERGKSPGARYIAGRIWSGADPDLKSLAQDWFAHRNIRRELSEEEMSEIDARALDLRQIGIHFRWEARRFYELYRQVRVPGRSWNSPYQPCKGKVRAIALTPGYEHLPVWVKRAMINSNCWIESGENARLGNVWRFVNCAKAWKHAPGLPKGIAEKVGKLSPRSRLLAHWAWEATCDRFRTGGDFRYLHELGWKVSGQPVDRAEMVNEFWWELRRLSGLSLPALIAEQRDTDHLKRFSLDAHNRLRQLAEMELGLPHGYLLKAWGRHRSASEEKYLEVYLEALLSTQGVEQVCRRAFGDAGKATVEAFQSSSPNAWRWAEAVCDRNPDAAQEILKMADLIEFQPEAIEFLKSLPLEARIRLLGATTFEYQGQVCPATPDHVHNTVCLWRHVKKKPDLAKARCWLAAQECLSAAFLKELPADDEPLPVLADWERADGLCAVDGSWSLELPRSVAMLKYYGELFRSRVRGYGNVIRSERSVFFGIRECGAFTHCGEVIIAPGRAEVRQFYSRHSEPNHKLMESVCQALRQADLINRY